MNEQSDDKKRALRVERKKHFRVVNLAERKSLREESRRCLKLLKIIFYSKRITVEGFHVVRLVRC